MKLIPYKGGDYTIPSIFAIDDKGNELIGYEAKRQWQLNPRNTIYGAKRLIGRDSQDDIVETMQQVVAVRGAAPADDNDVVIDVAKQELRRCRRSAAKILNKIRDVASNYLQACRSRARWSPCPPTSPTGSARR